MLLPIQLAKKAITAMTRRKSKMAPKTMVSLFVKPKSEDALLPFRTGSGLSFTMIGAEFREFTLLAF